MKNKLKREGRQLEYKEMLSNYRSISRTIVAFSNDIGGDILIGVRDKDRSLIGLTEGQIEQYLEDVPKAAFDAISPYCVPEITTQWIGEKCLIRIRVHSGERKPYFIKSEGSPKGVYVRVGPHSRRVTPELYQDLLRQGARRSWDEEITDIDVSQLDQTLLRTYYNGPPDSSLLQSDHVAAMPPLSSDFRVTHAGVVFFHPHPSSALPQCELLYSEFAGETLTDPVRTIDISAPLPVTVSRVVELLKNHLVEEEEVTGVIRRPSRWSIPERAVREVLLNALIHRMYAISSAVKVALFPDRLEVFSPGNFPGPIDLEQLGNGVSYARNPRLRHLARKAGLVEKRGLGFRLILDTCKENQNRRPVFVEGGDYVKVTLFRGREKTSDGLPEDAQVLRANRDNNRSIKTGEAKEILGVSINTARSRLKDLVRLGYLQPKGKGRATTYYWT
jgi:ATP-dependent DNA helicase RecG